MGSSRTKNAIKNSSFIVFDRVLQLVFSFAFRTLMIKYLGAEILGLNGLFSSIISILNMVDLGISSAIIFSLYKPLAENNERKVFAIMQFLQTFYIAVGSFIMVAGLCLLPVLPYIINLPTEVSNINTIYILTIASTAMTYIFSSRNLIFEASQQGYKIGIVNIVYMVLMQSAQMILVVIFKNYVMTLIVRLVGQVLSNAVVYFYARKRFEVFRKFKREKLRKDEKKELFGNVGAVFCHKIGTVFVTGTDNLIISMFISTIVVAVYSNYLLIISSITTILILASNAIVASIGNMKADSEDIEAHYKVFKMTNIVLFMFNSFICICLFCLLNPFIKAWVGGDYLFGITTVLLLCINNYISTMRFSIGNFVTAAGYFKKTMIKPIAEGIINIIVSLSTVKYLGVVGVFLGTTASLVLGSLWVDPYIAYKHWFKKPVIKYYSEYAWMAVLTASLGAACYAITTLFSLSNLWLDFIVKGIVTVTIAGGVLLLCCWKTKGFQMLWGKLKGFLVRKNGNSDAIKSE